MAVSKGFARACESVIATPTRHRMFLPKGRTEGSPNVQTREGVRRGRPASPCIVGRETPVELDLLQVEKVH